MTCVQTSNARVFTDMDTVRKFQMSTSGRSVPVGSLHPDHQYPIVHAERVITRYAHSVRLAILDSPTTSVKLVLPKRYGDVVSDEVIEDSNSKRVLLYLIYRRTCAKTNPYILK